MNKISNTRLAAIIKIQELRLMTKYKRSLNGIPLCIINIKLTCVIFVFPVLIVNYDEHARDRKYKRGVGGNRN